MATVIYGPLVTGVAGSIGGTTFQRAGSASVARRRPHPPRPLQSGQRAAQMLLAAASREWTLKSDGDRSGWRSRALTITLTNSLGQTYHPTGQQLYIWCFCAQNRLGISAVTLPTQPGLCIEHAPTLAEVTGDLHCTVFTPAFPAGAFAWFTVYAPDTPRAFPRTSVISIVGWNDTLGFPIELAIGWLAGYATGSVVRTHVSVRQVDEYFRPSLQYWYYLDVTV